MKFTYYASAAALIFSFAACGDDDSPVDSGTSDGFTSDAGGITCLTMDPVVEILDNHPTGDHQLTIPVADVLAGVEMTYDIRGDNTGHTHDVTVTASDYELLQAGTSVSIVSTDNGSVGMSHTHTVNLSCP